MEYQPEACASDLGDGSRVTCYKNRTSVHRNIENKIDYSVRSDSIQKTVPAKSSTGTEAKLYLTFNSSLVTLIFNFSLILCLGLLE